jgi:thioredoxin-like negative regulator of GroEL
VKRPARFALLSAAALFLCSPAFAQATQAPPNLQPSGGVPPVPPRLAISGNIVDEADSKPLQNATVTLNDSDGAQLNSVTTGLDGGFRFERVPSGDYFVNVAAPGFASVNQEIELRGEITLRIRLRRDTAAASPTNSLDPAAHNSVSTRELALPAKAREALASGRNRLYQLHDAAGSIPYFEKVLKAAPDFYEAYYYEGVAYNIEAKLANAEGAFRKSIDASKGQYADPCFALASLLIDQKRIPEGEDLLHKAMALQPDDWQGYYSLARILYARGQFGDAEKDGVEARKRNPGYAPLYLVLAKIDSRMNNNQAVLDDLTAFLKLDPNGPNSAQARAIETQLEQAIGHPPSPQPMQ